MPKRLALIVAVVVASLFHAGPVTAQTPSPELLAAAKELMVVTRASKNIEKLMPTIIEAMKPAIVQGRPEVARDYPAIAKAVVESLAGQRDTLVEAVSLIYARHFTVEELREVTVFLRRSVGQKFIDKMPLISHESMLIGQRIGQEAAAQVREKIVDELRKRSHKI